MGKRTTVRVGDRIILDEASPTPVTIDVYAVNGNGKDTSNENDRSLAVLITYGSFRAEIGGDLSGSDKEDYTDIETGVASGVGKLDLYKVHHHCSSFSSDQAWLAATMPTVAIISSGDRNEYGHPAVDCVERLHRAGAQTYWTEQGNGAVPLSGWDTISGTTIVSVDLGAMQYTVTYGSNGNVYSIGGGPQETTYFTRTSFPF
jgi:beta-lactamase superfamily II metal-dependent hydrolase